MADTPPKKNARLSFWGLRLLTISSRVAALFATRLARVLILLVCILIGAYLSYQRVWLPITATAPLPPGVAEKSPQLNSDLLSIINTQRVERVEAARQRFTVEALFRPPITPPGV